MAYSTNNSSINVHLYQCNTNSTILNATTIPPIDTIFNNLPYSCNINCCTSNSTSRDIEMMFKNSFNFIYLASINLCQVTVHTSTGDCLGRICYSGACDQFSSLANKTKNTTTLMNQLQSSFASIPWFLWIDKTGLTVRHTIIIILLIVNISLTLMTLIVVMKSIRQANIIAEDKAYRYTLL